MTERLTAQNEQCRNPFVSIYHISPISALSMVPISLAVDLNPFLDSRFTHDPKLFIESFLLILFGGLIAFVLLLVEVKLVNLTSSLTLGVLGQMKELVQISLAIVVFKDNLTNLNLVGLILSVVFVGTYKWIRRGELREALLAESVPSIKEQAQVMFNLIIF